ncbi:hypothetical protein [Labrys miyagiensis]|uniref:hypothetical protein n=1 Tax=Labrys miyagiensis TaxID=346912 RepID=UPI0024E12243|nr:hypothetical protein [Labrys miyagiensis]
MPDVIALWLCLLFVAGFLLASSDPLAAQSALHDDVQALLAGAVQACWPASIPLPGNAVQIKLSLKPDGSLASRPVLAEATGALADRVKQATLLQAVERCAPFKTLRAFRGSYRSWRETTIALSAPVLAPAAPTTAAATAAPIQAPASTKPRIEPGMILSAALGLVLFLQMLSDTGFAWQSWRGRRRAARSGPWQPRSQPFSDVRRKAEPLDPVSDPKNWRV